LFYLYLISFLGKINYLFLFYQIFFKKKNKKTKNWKLKVHIIVFEPFL